MNKESTNNREGWQGGDERRKPRRRRGKEERTRIGRGEEYGQRIWQKMKREIREGKRAKKRKDIEIH